MAKMPTRSPIARLGAPAKPIGKGRIAPISGGLLRSSRPRVAPPGMKTKALPRTGGRLPPVVKDFANLSTFTGRPPVVKDYANPGYQPSNKISRPGASAKPVGKVRATLISSKPLRSQKPPVVKDYANPGYRPSNNIPRKPR